MEFFKKIVNKFKVDGELVSCERYGEGHINSTYLAVMDKDGVKTDYILQKINNGVFKDVVGLMNNIKLVTEFNRAKILENGGNPDRESLSLIYTKTGDAYYHATEDDGYYRMYIFITDAVAYQAIEKPEHFYQSAVAFGNFAKLLAEFNASELVEVIPNFHNTVKRFENLEKSIKLDKMGRAKSVKEEIEFALNRKDICDKIVSLLDSGKMPTKVTHNDTKLNNVMLDVNTGEPVAVIDLDTIMPGSICYDFGDSIRFGCSTAREDEKDLDKVNFNVELFDSYTRGYLTALGDSVTQVEKEHLVWGAILMTFECGIRFLTDYLDGDVYFHVSREGHNLDRCRTQFKLVQEMEKKYDQLQEIVNKY